MGLNRGPRIAVIYATGAITGGVQRIVAAASAGDGAGRVDDRDARTAVEPHRRQADARVVVGVDLFALAAAPQLVDYLIFVRDVVDQARVQRVLGQERPRVEQAAHLRFVLAAPVGDAA